MGELNEAKADCRRNKSKQGFRQALFNAWTPVCTCKRKPALQSKHDVASRRFAAKGCNAVSGLTAVIDKLTRLKGLQNLFAAAVTQFLAPASDGAQQGQSAVEVGDDGYPAAALAIAAAAPTAGDAPLPEQVTIQNRAIEACAPGKQQLDWLMGHDAVVRLYRHDDGRHGRCAVSRHGSGPAPGAFWPARLHTAGVRCIALRADAWVPHRQRRPAPGQWKPAEEKRWNR